MNSAREVGRRESCSLLGLPLQAVELQGSQRMLQRGCPYPLSEHCCHSKCQRHDATSRVCRQLETGSSGVMTPIWGLLSFLFQGSVKYLSQADPVPGNIPPEGSKEQK